MRTILSYLKVYMQYVKSTVTLAFFLLVLVSAVQCTDNSASTGPVAGLVTAAPVPTSDEAAPTKLSEETPLAAKTATSIATETQTLTILDSAESTVVSYPTFEPLTPETTSFKEVQTSTASPTSTVVPSTATPIPTIGGVVYADDVDRSCPNPSPERPEYFHYYLSGNQWPEPEPDNGDHFWLTEPFEGGARLLITEWFPYGYDAGGRYLIHNGIDMAEPMGTPILAVADGTVVVAGDDFAELYGWRCDWYGQLVVIQLDDLWAGQPVYVLYGHVHSIAVEVGQRVERGQSVAEVGFGGAASRPHLHFEVRVGENTFRGTRNPLLWVAPSSNRGLIVGRLVDPDGRPWQGVSVSAIGQSEGTKDYTSWTYLGDPELVVNPDETYAENFVIGDVAPGTYDLVVSIQGVIYSVEIQVGPAGVTVAEIVTVPYKTPTPTPANGGS
jgi:murein DD-endopeptidase MepM/ murein hydrolase activator NlpD